MTLVEAIQQYLVRKRATGLIYEKGELILCAFGRVAGDVQLASVTTQTVLTYLDGLNSSANTWRSRYGVLKLFFEFWTARETMSALLLPPIRIALRQQFPPYIYSRAGIRALLRAVPENQERHVCAVDGATLRTLLLLLYGTGAMTGEVYKLQLEDVDLRGGFITFQGNRITQSRRIPISPDVRDLLKNYLQSKCRKGIRSTFVFVEKSGNPIRGKRLMEAFIRLRCRAGIGRDDGAYYQPRMVDLRSTFAVHRITSWIKNGADLNRMLPALSAYMGLAGFTSIERYLALTPERFKKALNKLSPRRGKGHWRDNPTLMRFLASL